MIDFKSFLTEEKNLHLEHLEDSIINDGSRGFRDAINFVSEIVSMLSGNSSGKYGITVKWDGAPAVFAGTNPENGRFFVGTKSIFNATPKINYTNADIDNNHGGALADKLKVCLKNLPKIGINGIIQGDLMFTKGDLVSQKIDNETYVTFTPNTITYAVPAQSDFAKKLVRAEMGIVWHTTYSGKTMDGLKASFGADTSSMRQTSSVWFDNADFKDESGVATFTTAETKQLKTMIANLKSLGDRSTLSAIDSLVSGPIQADLKIFYNSLIRGGEVGTPSVLYNMFKEYIEKKYQTAIDKLKTDRAKERKMSEMNSVLSFIRSNNRAILRLFAIHRDLTNIKMVIVRKIESVKSIGMFLRTDDGYEVTAPEGFVAIDRLGKSAFKLVDRLTFSRANFNAAKNWEKG